MFLGGRQPLDVGSAAAAFGFATLLVTVAALIVRRVFSATRLAAPLFLTSLTFARHPRRPVDRAGRSSPASSRTRSPPGWRFYGMGNEGAAILVGASIAAVALATDAPRREARAERRGAPVRHPGCRTDRARDGGGTVRRRERGRRRVGRHRLRHRVGRDERRAADVAHRRPDRCSRSCSPSPPSRRST